MSALTPVYVHFLQVRTTNSLIPILIATEFKIWHISRQASSAGRRIRTRVGYLDSPLKRAFLARNSEPDSIQKLDHADRDIIVQEKLVRPLPVVGISIVSDAAAFQTDGEARPCIGLSFYARWQPLSSKHPSTHS